jgi:hypothetical protein
MGGGQEPPDEKEELIRQLKRNGNTYFAPHLYGEPGEIICVEFPVEELADFILSLRKSESVNFEDSTPPLDTEDLEKQIQSIINHAKWNVGFVPDPESPKWQENVKFEAKEILALVTQHTQVAVENVNDELVRRIYKFMHSHNVGVNTEEVHTFIVLQLLPLIDAMDEQEFLARLKLEFDANVSVAAGERWSDSDAAEMVNHRLEHLEQRKKEKP